MSPDPEVICEASGGLGLATLHRPKALNALTLAMVESIRANYEAWDLPTSAVHCILLRGAGKPAATPVCLRVFCVFSSGIDRAAPAHLLQQ